MATPKVHHSAICVRDVDESLRFYRDGLGLTVTMDEEFDGDPDGVQVELIGLGARDAGRSRRRRPRRAMHSVEGRVIIVTGSGQGVGRGMANHLGKAGASIVVAEWNAEKMHRTVDELTAVGVPAIGIETDIRSREQIDAMVAGTVEHFGKVDAIVNNAQTFRANAPVADVSAEDVEVFYQSGVLGTLYAMQAVYPHMKAAGWGRIVNFASSMGRVGGAGFGAYNASKEAIRGLSRTAAREWAADGIIVNLIAPAAAPPRARRQRALRGVHAHVADGPQRRPRARHRSRSRTSCAPTRAATSPARRSWSTAATSCGREGTS